MKTTSDFLIVGAGIIGVNIALSLRDKYPDSKITILEKETEPGLHASGRNSGVLHAGFYYSSDSIKARFCKEGNLYLTDYCLEHNLPINQCGKLVVAENESELKGLNELLKRSQENNVELIEVDEKQAKEIEPNVRTYQKALFSPSTSSVDPKKVMASLFNEVNQKSITLKLNTEFISKNEKVIKTTTGSIEAGYLINAAGLHADKIAMQYGFSEDYRIVPFKGIYLYVNPSKLQLKTHIYPVPDLNNPFLGVHFTLDVNGNTKIGPSATPAFWREQYGGIRNFNFREMVEIGIRDSSLFFYNHSNFRNLAFRELKNYSKKNMAKEASKMVSDFSVNSVNKWGKPGIRAQLINLVEKKLEMDFIFEGDDKSWHILNAVSPAFTCSKPFTDFLVERISQNIN